MSLEFSIAHLMLLECSPIELIQIADRTGYHYVSLRLTAVAPSETIFPLVTDRRMMKSTKAQLAETGVKILDIELARMGPDVEPDSYLPILDAGAELGARHLIGQLPDPNRERAIDRFAKLCDLAVPFNITVNLEFPSWTETPSLNAAADVLKQVNRPNAGILVDILHFARSDSTLDQLSALPREWFNFVHLCDAAIIPPDSTAGLIHTARCDRNFPGEGGINVRDIIECMPQVPYSLEIPNNILKKQLGAEEYARRAINTAKQYLESP